MRKCIWCKETSEEKTFKKLAHTFPNSLDGKNICENVCDECNHYFGSPTQEGSSVEVFLKEALNLSKYLYHQMQKIPKNKRYKSEFFAIDLNGNRIKTKFRYKFERTFQERAGRQFRRGMFKVFLEERERQKKDAQDSRFDFIREFARYNKGDHPIFRFKPKFKALFFRYPM